jgi:hypothetical protein
MKPILLALTVAAFSVFSPLAAATAQDEKVARGVISDIGSASMTLQVRGEPLELAVDRHTVVQAPGGSTKARQASMNGQAGPHLSDVLKVGQAVAVTYRDLPGDRRASMVRVTARPGGAGASIKTASIKTASAFRSIGVVKVVDANSITINGQSGGGAHFTQTFTLGPDTLVIGKGAGTAAAASGGRVPATKLIAAGDHVTVAYHKDGNALRASDIRVTMKGSH